MAQSAPEHLSTLLHTLHPLEPEARRSDYIVPEAAQIEFCEMRRIIESEVGRLDMELARLQHMMDGLQGKRAACMQRIAEINAAIAPHKKLPPELLSAIFLQVHKQESPLELPPPRHSYLNKGPWFLSRLCSRWRQVVCNTPAYWQAVTFSGSFLAGLEEVARAEQLLRSLEMTKEILRRGTRVLMIHITSCVALPAGVNPLGDLLTPFSAQLQTISLGCCPDILEPFLYSSPLFFPVLKSLDLTLWTADSNSSDQVPPDSLVFSNAPSLRKVRINTGLMGESYTNPHLQLHNLCIPWGQLAELSLVGRRINLADCSILLPLCHNLAECYLQSESQCRENAILSVPQFPVVLSRLRVLELHVYEQDDAAEPLVPSQFFGSLVLPSLTCLTLGLHLPPPTLLEINLADMIIRSGCKLERFKTLTPVPVSLLDELLPTISPTLQELEITESEISIPSLERIALGTLLPKLTSLWCCIPSVMGLDAFVEVIERRWDSGDNSVSDIHTAYAESPRTLPEFWMVVQARCRALNQRYKDQGRSITAGVVRHPVFAW